MKDFLVELVKRFLSNTPSFFKVVKVLAIITALVAGIPTLLESSGVILPNVIAALASKIVSISALVAAFIAQLTTTDKSILAKQ
jgi:hypothetical protein